MIEREYVIYQLKNGIKDIMIVCNIKNSETLNTFLGSDVRAFEDWIKAAFDKVLSGESEYEEVAGNICCAEISPKTTKVYVELIEDDEEYYSTCCEVDTQELRQIIEEWCEKVREFKNGTMNGVPIKS